MTEQGSPALESQPLELQSPKVAVIGLGYVGLPLALLFVSKGFKVYGIDVDERKISMLEANRSYLPDLTDAEIESYMKSGRFHPVTDFTKAGEAEAIIICVPTPLTPYHTPDLSYLQNAAQAVGEQLGQGQTVILESSTYPGTTREVVKPILEKTSGLRSGKDFYLGYSPERIDPGNKDYTVERIPKLISGLTNACADRVEHLYRQVFQAVVRVSTPETAEMAKIVENSQRLVNITFINELALICDEMNIDVWEVIDAAATKPFGFTAYYPGPGIGGHCIPVDPLYLQWKSKLFNMESKFIGISELMNRAMPQVVADKVYKLLANSRHHAAVDNHTDSEASAQPASNNQNPELQSPRILLYGVAYKKDVNDVRESPALELIPILQGKGARVEYHDPYIPRIVLQDDVVLESVALTDEKLQESDIVVIITDHTGIPVEQIVRMAPLVFDTRNATAAVKDANHVHRLGGGRRNTGRCSG